MFGERAEASDRSAVPRALLAPTALLFVVLLVGGNGGGRGAEEGDPGLHRVNLVWDPVVANEDGTPITDVAGYRIHVGAMPGRYTSETEVGPDVTEATIGVPAGTFYIAVTAYDVSGNESDCSNELMVSHRHRGGEGQALSFRRGDVNADTRVDVSDAVWVLAYLFASGQKPPCVRGGDANGDGALNVADPVYLLGFLLLGRAEPPAPFPDCGVGPAPDDLGCLWYPSCE